MKIKYALALGFLFFQACSDSKREEKKQEAASQQVEVTKPDTFPLARVIPIVACRINPALTYSLYLPRQIRSGSKLAALIFADPHGNGSLPVMKFQALAEKFGVILIGSNDSKNGMTFNQATPVLQSLVSEATARYGIDKNLISLAGFSGGAKAALMAASETLSVLTVTYCGAGFAEIPRPLPPSLGIAGLKDINYTEVVQTDGQMESKGIKHSIVEWPGKHEWCDSSTFQNCFYWMAFRAMEKKIIPVNDMTVQEFIKQNSRTFNDPLSEESRLKKLISFLGGVADTSAYSSALTAHQKQPVFLKAKENKKSDFELEARMKENYLKCMTLKDVYWWHAEIARLKSLSKDAMNARILGYISLACYSYSGNALKQEDLRAAEKYLAIYAFADRENIDRAYMQACLYGKMKNDAGTLQSLREAIRYGFKDKAKLESEPSFSFIRPTDDYRKLIQGIN